MNNNYYLNMLKKTMATPPADDPMIRRYSTTGDGVTAKRVRTVYDVISAWPGITKDELISMLDDVDGIAEKDVSRAISVLTHSDNACVIKTDTVPRTKGGFTLKAVGPLPDVIIIRYKPKSKLTPIGKAAATLDAASLRELLDLKMQINRELSKRWPA